MSCEQSPTGSRNVSVYGHSLLNHLVFVYSRISIPELINFNTRDDQFSFPRLSDQFLHKRSLHLCERHGGTIDASVGGTSCGVQAT